MSEVEKTMGEGDGEEKVEAILKQALTVVPKIDAISKFVLQSQIGRQEIVRATWLAIVAHHPAFFYGSPGIAKTATVKAMMRSIAGAEFLEELMPTVATGAQLVVEGTVLSETPDGHGGKVIAAKNQLGGVAKKNIFFADEIWKAEAMVLRLLFDLFNLDPIRWDGQVINHELLTILAASNELPDPESNLYALWSRMTLRVPVLSLDRTNKLKLVATRLARYQAEAVGKHITPVQISLEDVKLLAKARPFIILPDAIQNTVLDVYDTLLAQDREQWSWLWDDDRKFGRVMDILQASALLAGRDTVTKADLVVLKWMLWDTVDQIAAVNAVIDPLVRTPLNDAQEAVDALLALGGDFDAILNHGDRKKLAQGLQKADACVQQLKGLQAQANADDKAAVQKLIDDVEKLKTDAAMRAARGN